MSPYFNVYVAVDWSASRNPGPVKPKKDALWMAWEDASGARSVAYFRTRESLMEALAERCRAWLAEKQRILAGFDFAFGYPAGFAAAAQLPGGGAPWERTWAYLEEAFRTTDDRFSVADALNARCGELTYGPFWGLAGGKGDREHLARKRTGFNYPYPLGDGRHLQRLRHTDAATKGVQEVWKLAGIGSVGSQALTGIAHLEQFRKRPALREFSVVWPLETGFALPEPEGPRLVIAEIFPSPAPQLPEEPDAAGQAEIRDRRQVRSLVAHLKNLDQRGDLKPRFGAPAAYSDVQITECVAEEAAILPI
ncbi:MAG: hypothetical protein AAGN35_18310 [Bacteroidota bacterium]